MNRTFNFSVFLLLFAINAAAQLEEDLARKIEALKKVDQKLKVEDFSDLNGALPTVSAEDFQTSTYVSEEQLLKTLTEKLSNSPVGSLIDTSSETVQNTLRTVVKVGTDRKSRQGFLKIVEDKERLKKYAYASIGILLGGLLLGLVLGRRDSWLVRIFQKVSISVVMVISQAYAFYYFFSEEIKPAIEIVKRNMLS